MKVAILGVTHPDWLGIVALTLERGLGRVKDSIFIDVGGIIQADGEGFSNEDGYHILWQFSNSVAGPWWMGVLKDGEWVHFRMDLGDKEQREAFMRGEVPHGVELAE